MKKNVKDAVLNLGLTARSRPAAMCSAKVAPVPRMAGQVRARRTCCLFRCVGSRSGSWRPSSPVSRPKDQRHGACARAPVLPAVLQSTLDSAGARCRTAASSGVAPARRTLATRPSRPRAPRCAAADLGHALLGRAAALGAAQHGMKHGMAHPWRAPRAGATARGALRPELADRRACPSVLQV